MGRKLMHVQLDFNWPFHKVWLCEWAAEHASTFADFKASKEDWKAMLSDGFVYHQTNTGVVFI